VSRSSGPPRLRAQARPTGRGRQDHKEGRKWSKVPKLSTDRSITMRARRRSITADLTIVRTGEVGAGAGGGSGDYFAWPLLPKTRPSTTSVTISARIPAGIATYSFAPEFLLNCEKHAGADQHRGKSDYAIAGHVAV
jgi:hypothetical protein